MKVRSTLTLLAVLIAGTTFYFQSNRSDKAIVVSQQTRPSPTPEASPNRALRSNERFIAPAGLYISIPEGMNFRQEAANYESLPDARTAGFYIEQGEEAEPTYQLYGLYQASRDVSEQGLEKAKKEMDPAAIKDVTVGGYKGIEGVVMGQKNRHITIIIIGDKLISFSTFPTTIENKEITDQILSTISFQRD